MQEITNKLGSENNQLTPKSFLELVGTNYSIQESSKLNPLNLLRKEILGQESYHLINSSGKHIGTLSYTPGIPSEEGKTTLLRITLDSPLSVNDIHLPRKIEIWCEEMSLQRYISMLKAQGKKTPKLTGIYCPPEYFSNTNQILIDKKTGKLSLAY